MLYRAEDDNLDLIWVAWEDENTIQLKFGQFLFSNHLTNFLYTPELSQVLQ